MKRTGQSDQALIDAFVATFSVKEFDDYCQENWQPLATFTEQACLSPLYSVLPGRFPPLYERLVLSYRWPAATLPRLTLLENPPGSSFDGLLAQIRSDRGLWEALAPAGYIQFGRGPFDGYDPVCFDTRHRHRDGDCPVLQIDHEEILCNYRIKVVSVVANSFRELVLATLE